MKKALFSGFIAISIFAISLGVYSCKNETVNPTPDVQMMQSNQVVPDEVMNSFDAKEFTVFSDLTNDIQVYPPFVQGYRPDARFRMREMHERMGMGYMLNEILHDFKLSRNQLKIFENLMHGYQDCVKEVMATGAAERKRLLTQAQADRDAVIAQFRIDHNRAQANAALDLINDNLKDALDATIDPMQLCQCLQRLFADISSNLTGDQKTRFDAWVVNQQLPCDTAPNNPNPPAP